MKLALDWTVDEFEILLQNPNLSDNELHEKLLRRTASAISIGRNGIHAFHADQDISMLSKLMANRLEENQAPLYCSKCGITLE